MRKIAIINHKGGVGKTTSAINIAAGLAKKGNRVLAVDADPQANMTESFGVFDVEQSIYNALSEKKPLPIIQLKNNLSLVPSSLDLSGFEVENVSTLSRERLLLNLLKPIEKDYDYCIIDCPPSLGLIITNALVAANDIYIPMVAEFLAYRGIGSICNVINMIKEDETLNPSLEIRGVFFTRFNGKIVLSNDIKEKVKEIFGDTLMKTVIRTNISLAESQALGQDIFEYAEKSNGAIDYWNLVKEIINN